MIPNERFTPSKPPLPHLVGPPPNPVHRYWAWAGFYFSAGGWLAVLVGIVLAIPGIKNPVAGLLLLLAGFAVSFGGFVCGIVGRQYRVGKTAIALSSLQFGAFFLLAVVGTLTGKD